MSKRFFASERQRSFFGNIDTLRSSTWTGLPKDRSPSSHRANNLSRLVAAEIARLTGEKIPMESFLGSLSVTRTLLVEALVAMVILSILVTIFYEAIKANLQISFRKRSFEGWWKRLMRLALDSSEKYVFESDTPNIVDATGRRVPLGPAPDLTDRLGFDTETGSFEWEALRAGSLPDELFMRKIENMGRTILERPAKNP